MSRIGGSNRVREELTAAFADGRGVTAKVRWVTKADEEGRNKWIHCTPLVGVNGQIGVWMVVIVNEDKPGRRAGTGGRHAPAVAERSRTPSGMRSQPANMTNGHSNGYANGTYSRREQEDDRRSLVSDTSLRI